MLFVDFRSFAISTRVYRETPDLHGIKCEWINVTIGNQRLAEMFLVFGIRC
jgi:hypothetical protein